MWTSLQKAKQAAVRQTESPLQIPLKHLLPRASQMCSVLPWCHQRHQTQTGIFRIKEWVYILKTWFWYNQIKSRRAGGRIQTKISDPGSWHHLLVINWKSKRGKLITWDRQNLWTKGNMASKEPEIKKIPRSSVYSQVKWPIENAISAHSI